MSKETPIKRALVDALAALGVEAWVQNAGRVKVRGGWCELGPEGIPDVIGRYPRRKAHESLCWLLPRGVSIYDRLVAPGAMFGVEIKILGNTTKKSRVEAQRVWGERLVRDGGVYVANCLSVEQALRELGFVR